MSQKTNQNSSRLWPIEAIQGEKDLTCKKLSKTEKKIKIHSWVGLQIDSKIVSKPAHEIRRKQFFHQITKCSFKFLPFHEVFFPHHHFIGGFAKETKETNFSFKSSWKVDWIIMLQKDVVCLGPRKLKRRKVSTVSISTVSSSVRF